jgi:CBS domain containing-hemolysin-like protein
LPLLKKKKKDKKSVGVLTLDAVFEQIIGEEIAENDDIVIKQSVQNIVMKIKQFRRHSFQNIADKRGMPSLDGEAEANPIAEELEDGDALANDFQTFIRSSETTKQKWK